MKIKKLRTQKIVLVYSMKNNNIPNLILTALIVVVFLFDRTNTLVGICASAAVTFTTLLFLFPNNKKDKTIKSFISVGDFLLVYTHGTAEYVEVLKMEVKKNSEYSDSSTEIVIVVKMGNGKGGYMECTSDHYKYIKHLNLEQWHDLNLVTDKEYQNEKIYCLGNRTVKRKDK